MIHYSRPPVLLRDVFEDTSAVVRLLEEHAPYTPLGGWYRPGINPDVPSSPLWFQNDWVHAGLRVRGSELFLEHEPYLEAARKFYDAEVVRPHSVYVNCMVAMDRAGPAHTDNPRFQGRDRSNTPMWLLRTMLWSGLFEAQAIRQATAIWWLGDVEGGGLVYWPDGPDRAPVEHVGAMANTALIGDNHGMFHQVGRVGPFDRGTPLVTPRATLAPAASPAKTWRVIDRGETVFEAPLGSYRVSVLWKADVFRDAAEERRQTSEPLSMEDVAVVFDRDLSARGEPIRFDLARVETPDFVGAIQAIYPEAVPIESRPSIFDDR